ncbi:MAG: hypothetical protein COV74_02280 [Candidatus Omnitrophica bacterium CG11_big_fil_rev_8_21_14_0_20_45_26]|uniref:Uncharacterized protein n=1 Tax=Candidatus Abzuiibacterium crystallinum TaxID=1974748 RepID=A0A2H0LRE8_9BACT|nr:MAG: hypothetical protein COV74_02280 [Candidatus Omnitrophica bacterium CG11_big_fil_rev_8_21_14_0_20_45_26]PIW64566.1 MAG: hypothetical protein COW12_05605 [Candidatus Omnitrophica bacterium CG12_big_fil_rev_8_21_14_0_65_45_16]
MQGSGAREREEGKAEGGVETLSLSLRKGEGINMPLGSPFSDPCSLLSIQDWQSGAGWVKINA